jgi:hypothetical protein
VIRLAHILAETEDFTVQDFGRGRTAVEMTDAGQAKLEAAGFVRTPTATIQIIPGPTPGLIVVTLIDPNRNPGPDS